MKMSLAAIGSFALLIAAQAQPEPPLVKLEITSRAEAFGGAAMGDRGVCHQTFCSSAIR
jgi:hypothetical protein